MSTAPEKLERHPPEAEEAPPLLGDAGTPVATAALVACIVVGAIAGYALLPAEEWSALRRAAGGAVSGFGCWLLVMVGRLIG